MNKPIELYKKDAHEILQKISNMATREERIEALRDLKDAQAMINDILAIQFNRYIQDHISIPDGPIPEDFVTISPEASFPSSLHKQYRNFKNLLRVPSNHNPQAVRERIFKEIVESVHPKDAQLVINLFTKQKWKYGGISRKVVEDALPKLLEKPVWVK